MQLAPHNPCFLMKSPTHQIQTTARPRKCRVLHSHIQWLVRPPIKSDQISSFHLCASYDLRHLHTLSETHSLLECPAQPDHHNNVENCAYTLTSLLRSTPADTQAHISRSQTEHTPSPLTRKTLTQIRMWGTALTAVETPPLLLS